MIRKKYDAIVVGGGPAGATAAYTLAGSGMNVCLVDKSVFPRDKLCGGLLTQRSRTVFHKVFATSWQPAVEGVSRGMRFFYRDRWLNTVDDCQELTWTRRYIFDAYLVDLARKRGADAVLGRAVREVDTDAGTITLSGGMQIGADFLVGADGVNSSVAQSLFGQAFDKNTIAFGLEMEAPLDGTLDRIADPEIYFGLVKWGYGWVFPKQRTLTLGVAGLWRQNPDIKHAFDGFVRKRCAGMPTAKIKGQYIPFGDYRRRPGRGSVLLCGDAAGVVEPITGEGIAFAMETGTMAGQAISQAAALNRPDTAFQFYAQRYASVARSLRWANVLRYLIFPKWSESLFIDVLPKTRSVPRRQMDLMAGELEYDEYVRFLLKKSSGYLVNAMLKRSASAFRGPGPGST